MTASPNIKTPSMDVPLLPGTGARVEGEKLKRRFTRVCLNQVNIIITSIIIIIMGGVSLMNIIACYKMP